MIGNPQRNGQAIKRGLKWLTDTKDEIAKRGLLNILPDAMAYAHELHDHGHFGHRITGDSYGWAVVHDGKIEALKVNSGNHGEGDAREQLERVASGFSQGWVGLVLASMNAHRDDGRPIIFSIEYEMQVLDATIDEIKDFFPAYFKRVQ